MDRRGSHISSAALVERRDPFQLIKQSQQGGLRFLFYRQHPAELFLCLDQFVLFGLLGSFVSGQRGLNLRRGRIVINRLLQGFRFRAGRAAKEATPTTAGGGIIGIAAVATPIAEHAAHAAAETDIPPRVHHFLDQWLNGVPVGVVGIAELIPNPVHHPLLHLGGIEVASTAATARAAAVAAIVVLCQKTAGAEA